MYMNLYKNVDENKRQWISFSNQMRKGLEEVLELVGKHILNEKSEEEYDVLDYGITAMSAKFAKKQSALLTYNQLEDYVYRVTEVQAAHDFGMRVLEREEEVLKKYCDIELTNVRGMSIILKEVAEYVKSLESDYKDRLNDKTMVKIKGKIKELVKCVEDFDKNKGLEALQNISSEIERRMNLKNRR